MLQEFVANKPTWVLFSKELDTGKFAFGCAETYAEAAKRFAALPPLERRFHECFYRAGEVRLFFDLEGQVSSDVMANAVKEVQARCHELFGAMEFLVLVGSRDSKESVHLISNAYGASMAHVRAAASAVFETLSESAQSLVDDSVYNQERTFRTAFSTGVNKQGVALLPCPHLELTPETFVQCLVLAPRAALPNARTLHVPDALVRAQQASSAFGVSTVLTNREVVEEVVDLIKRILDVNPQSDVKEGYGVIVVPLKGMPCPRNGWCPHKSNRALAFVHLPPVLYLSRLACYTYPAQVYVKFKCLDTSECGSDAVWEDLKVNKELTDWAREYMQQTTEAMLKPAT